MRAEPFERMKTLSEADEVSSMSPLIADVSPDDWEDACNYDKRSQTTAACGCWELE